MSGRWRRAGTAGGGPWLPALVVLGPGPGPDGLARAWPEPLAAVPGGTPLVVALVLAAALAGALVAMAVARRRWAADEREREAALARELAELRASERKHRALFEQSSVATLLLDPDLVVVDANRAALELLGCRRVELVGASTSELFVHLDGEPSSLRALSREGALHGHARRVRRRSGELIDVLLSAGEVRGEDGGSPVHQLVLRDVTRQRQIDESLQQSQKMEAIGRMAGGIAHDFNNILTAILGYAELLRNRVADDPGLRHDADVILREAERARTLTGQIQSFSRGKLFEPGVIDLGRVMGEVEELLRRVLAEDVELAVKCAEDLGCVRIDPAQLEQILVNLAVNARDAMPGGGRLSLRASNVHLDEERAAEVDVPGAGRYVQLVVRDEGLGMDPETRRKVFEPFFTTKPHGQGTGLGLAIVYGIVQQCGGGVQVESAPRRGTTFRIFFPHSPGPVDPVDREDPPTAARGRGETVLVVDDEPGIRQLMAETLEGSGYRVLVAEDGFEALRLAEAEAGKLDVVVSDIVMPGMNGRELARRLGVSAPAARVLLTTGYAQPDVDTRDLLETDAPLLRKPFLPSALLRKLHELLEEVEPPAAAR